MKVSLTIFRRLGLSYLVKDTLFYFLVLLFIILSAFPLFWMFSCSVKSSPEIFKYPPRFFPSNITSIHYEEVFELTNFTHYFINSALITLATVILSVSVATLSAYSLSRFRFRGSKLLTRGFLIAYMFPRIVLVIPLFIVIVAMGLADTRLSLILTYPTFIFPYSFLLLMSYFRTVPFELEESAMIDGASRFKAFCAITLPIASPGIIAVTIFTGILAWNEYLYALVFLTTDTLKTLPLGISTLINPLGIPSWGMLMAAGVLTTLPILVAFIYLGRWLVTGLAMGAVKE